MNYINNSAAMCCCSLDERDIISVMKRSVLRDTESSKVVTFSETPELGRTYVCTEMWVLQKGYAVLEYYPCEELARAAYDRLMKKLGLTGIVLNLEDEYK